MLVSTFEILVKPQLPKDLPNPPPVLQSISRTVIQGYFLTLANTTSSEVTISLVFTAVTPPIDTDETIAFLDVEGINTVDDPILDKAPGKVRFRITIPANDTSLFILQPNILKVDNDGKTLVEKADFEVRGYVEIFLSSLSAPKFAQLLLTPEHRGTFFNKDLDNLASNPQLDQIAYSLPTANGSALYQLKKGEL